MQDLWSLLKERDFLDKERRAIRCRLKVTEARIKIRSKRGNSTDMIELLQLMDALGYEEVTLHDVACKIGKIDRRVAEITEDMEQSANRQEGADNV